MSAALRFQGILHEGGGAVNGVDELAVGQRQEEDEDERQMEVQEFWHAGRSSQREEREPGDAGEQQQQQETGVHAGLLSVLCSRVA